MLCPRSSFAAYVVGLHQGKDPFERKRKASYRVYVSRGREDSSKPIPKDPDGHTMAGGVLQIVVEGCALCLNVHLDFRGSFDAVLCCCWKTARLQADGFVWDVSGMQSGFGS